MPEGASLQTLERDVVRAGICTGCGACVGLDEQGDSEMVDTEMGPIPQFRNPSARLEKICGKICPGKGVNYPELYKGHYGDYPDSWLLGNVIKVRTGYSGDEEVRLSGASGGVTTQVLAHLLESGRIDAAIVVRQGIPEPQKARVVIVSNVEELKSAAQSVYIPVATLDVLRLLEPGKRYAMTCLPDQSAALRALQVQGYEKALQIKYVLGPYTGTALYPSAITCFLRGKGVPKSEKVTSLKWRAGEWPGYLEIKTDGGRVLRSKKIYYNFLIPFFVTQNSLQNLDFVNEFADLAVGDAWSPKFEGMGGGHSVFVTRSKAMEEVISEMCERGLLVAEEQEAMAATEMHGHMMDFKRRGGYIRNRWRRCLGLKAPDFGFAPNAIPASRYAVEVVISSIFLLCRNPVARFVVRCIPESILGPVFNWLRLTWKSLSKPTKRKGLGNLSMEITE